MGMGLSNPHAYRDKAEDWYALFDSERRREILELLTDGVIEEHEQNPLGYRDFHSPQLQRVLNYFRTQPILGKYYVYTKEPWRDYRIAEVVERGRPPNVHDEPRFGSEEEAMHGVFVRRVSDLRAGSDAEAHAASTATQPSGD